MKNIFLLTGLIMIILFVSCGSQKVVTNENISGIYYAQLKKSGFLTTQYTLVLNKDNTFSFDIKVQDGNPKCKGNWKIEGNEFLMLECVETNVFEALTNGYMNQREHTIQIINKNKLKLNNVVLKRKK